MGVIRVEGSKVIDGPPEAIYACWLSMPSRGLPPAAIANPGLDSLLAAAAPADTVYFYFVACGDSSGSHVFSETLEEHNQNVDAANSGECES